MISNITGSINAHGTDLSFRDSKLFERTGRPSQAS